MKIKESLSTIFDETPLLSKTSPLMDDDLDEEEAIKVGGDVEELRTELERLGVITDLGGNRDHILACLAHMLYCVANSIPYNLAFFIAKRINHQCILVDTVMLYLGAPRQRKPRKDIDDDETKIDEGTSRVNTPSPTTYNNYLPQDVPQIFSTP
ncbi:hypothetical protein Tco_0868696 [Tanacetum coccineum]